MSEWEIFYSLNAEMYAPLEKAILQNVAIVNTSDASFLVSKVLLKFDCQKGNTYSVNCNKTIEPKQKVILPDIEFTIPLGMPTGSQRYIVGVETKQFVNGEWNPNSGFGRKGKFIEIRPLLSKDFKIFISHSNAETDQELIKSCKDALITCGLTGYFAESDNRAGLILWDKILREVTFSDAFLVLLTEAGSNSGDIREEVGMAIALNKNIIPVVQKGIEPHGSLKSRGIEWISYEPKKEIDALSDALKILMDLAVKKEERKPVWGKITKESQSQHRSSRSVHHSKKTATKRSSSSSKRTPKTSRSRRA